MSVVRRLGRMVSSQIGGNGVMDNNRKNKFLENSRMPSHVDILTRTPWNFLEHSIRLCGYDVILPKHVVL